MSTELLAIREQTEGAGGTERSVQAASLEMVPVGRRTGHPSHTHPLTSLHGEHPAPEMLRALLTSPWGLSSGGQEPASQAFLPHSWDHVFLLSACLCLAINYCRLSCSSPVHSSLGPGQETRSTHRVQVLLVSWDRGNWMTFWASSSWESTEG